MLLFLLACQKAEKLPDTNLPNDSHTESQPDSQPDSELPAELNGTPPENPVPAPEFEALNMDNTGRSRDNLIGHPIVMWFYPAANTSG